MKVKIFKIRLETDELMKDQDVLNDFLLSHEIIRHESTFVNGKEQFWSVILYYNSMRSVVADAVGQKYSAEADQLNTDEARILEMLKIWRSETAQRQKVPSYCIATNKELLSVAKFRPAKIEELCDVKGFGKYKIENYGAEIISILEKI